MRLADGETVERRARRDRERDADAALRPAARRRRARPVASAAGASATAAPRCRSTSRSRSRRAGRATSGSAQTAIVHLTPGLDGVSRAVNEAERGLLPAEATIVVGQPLTIDPSRAPDGRGLLWIQLQELPWRVKGDAAGELDVGDGAWTEELRERYADRIQARLAQHVPNLESSLLQARRPLAGRPAGRERQSPARRPVLAARSRSTRTCSGARSRRSPGHATPVERLWQIGASTWPGPGLGAGSGTLVAKQLLREAAAPVSPELSISQITTVGAVVRRRPRRLPRGRRRRDRDLGDEARRRLARAVPRRAGSKAATAVPEVPSILPLPLMRGPRRPGERVEAIRAGHPRAWRHSSRRASSS